ncbi:MAG: ATP-dependent helicase [Patescibacteria group bacterium]|nr:ATP-dependent helicase [Patescibacteria group bacterium]
MVKYVLKPFEAAGKNLLIDYRSELNDEQFTAVTDLNGSLLVLAGAGSGKTRTLVYRVAYLIEKGIKPDRILLMTFTNKASKEMLNRVEILLKIKPQGLWGGTFHHVGNRVLRIYGKKIGINPDFTILDSEDARDLAKVCLSEADFVRDKYFPKADTILKIISLSVNVNESIEKIVAERFSYLADDVVPKIESVAALYKVKKAKANSLDYDDLLSKWLELLETDRATQQKLATKFQHILVDEYQDTNYLQGKIIKLLAGPKTCVLAVGDDSQSIYSFRGATVKNILNFPKIFPDAKIYKLETNYRSTPQILRLANDSIKFNLNQFDKKLKTNKSDADKPVLASFYDANEQADFVCQRILELQSDQNIGLNEMAVLFRAHYQSLEIEMAFSKRNIPYDMRGGLRFFEQAHIKDVVAHLKALNNLNDEIAWLRILRLQPGIGEAIARRIWQQISSFPDLKTALSASYANVVGGKAASGWSTLAHLLYEMSAIGQNSVSQLMALILKSGYDKYITANFENATDRIDDLKELVEYASTYETLEKFLSDVALSEGFKGQSIVDYQAAPAEAVTLSTVHQAKGLEWKVVFIIGLADGQFPHAKVFDFPDQLEEERRLFYVAVTRAKDQLYMSYPMMSVRGDTFNRVSQFISEISEANYDKWDIESGAKTDYTDLADGDVKYVDEDRGSILDIYLKNRR